MQQRGNLAPISTTRKVAVWGRDEAASQVRDMLQSFGVSSTCIEDLGELEQYDLLVMPPAVEARSFFEAKDHVQGLLNWIDQGGRYLQLEQNYTGLTPLGQELFPAENTFVDLVVPAHPVFAGLGQQQFDVRMNPDSGYAIEYGINPFSINALAARGPFLGGRGVFNAVAEGTYGRGIIFTNQLLVTKLWEQDSAAATYLRNVLAYLLTTENVSSFTRPWEMKSRQFTVNPAQMVYVDLRPYATTGFADEVDGDQKGGWTDQGNNDLRMIPLGEQEFLGVPVFIVDPAANNGKSCIVLAGANRKYFPQKVEGIAVGNLRLSRLFFLHTLAWSSKKTVGEYRIHYADGTVEVVPITDGVNIGDWWFPNDLPEAPVAFVEKNPAGRGVGLWLFAWENPKEHVAISSIDFVSNGSSVLALVAISGELVNPNALSIDDFETERNWRALRDKKGEITEPVPTISRVSKEDDPEGVWQGDYALKVSMPVNTATGGAPVVFTKFPLEKIKAGENYQLLTFWIKSDSTCTLNITLPKSDWSSRIQSNVLVRGGQWQKIRLSLRKDMGLDKLNWDLADLRGEFFIYYHNYNNPVTFYIDDIRLE